MGTKTGRWTGPWPEVQIPKPAHHDELWEMVQYIDAEMQRVTGIDLAERGKDKSALVTMDLAKIGGRMRMRVIDTITFDSLPHTYDEIYNGPRQPEDHNPKAVYHTQSIPETDPNKRPVSAPSEAVRAKLRAKRKKRK